MSLHARSYLLSCSIWFTIGKIDTFEESLETYAELWDNVHKIDTRRYEMTGCSLDDLFVSVEELAEFDAKNFYLVAPDGCDMPDVLLGHNTAEAVDSIYDLASPADIRLDNDYSFLDMFNAVSSDFHLIVAGKFTNALDLSAQPGYTGDSVATFARYLIEEVDTDTHQLPENLAGYCADWEDRLGWKRLDNWLFMR